MSEPPLLEQLDRTRVRVGRRRLVYFSGCDYFRLATHPRVVAAAEEIAAQQGLNVAASRITTGNHPLYPLLEAALARFFGTPAAVLVPTGYLTNLVVAQALAGRVTHALVDENAHVALWDAATLLGCPVIQFGHRDPADLGRKAARCGDRARLLVMTDGLFAGDSAVAPLRAYRQVLPPAAWLMVDDAHGAGTLGRWGRGTVEVEAVSRCRLIQTITLSKAFGAFGGAVLGPRALRQRILTHSRIYAGSTPLPLPLAGAALAALSVLRQDSGLRRRLRQNTARVKQSLRRVGLAVPENDSPIVRLVPQSGAQAERLRTLLLAAGIFPPLVCYPGGPPGGAFRFVISSEHTPDQLDTLIAVLTRFVREQPRQRRPHRRLPH